MDEEPQERGISRMSDAMRELFAQKLIENLFLREIERNVAGPGARRIALPMRDPVLEAEVVYEDILDAEEIEDEPQNDPWATVRLVRKWAPVWICSVCYIDISEGGVWVDGENYCSPECAIEDFKK
jgi:hypothetical protein